MEHDWKDLTGKGLTGKINKTARYKGKLHICLQCFLVRRTYEDGEIMYFTSSSMSQAGILGGIGNYMGNIENRSCSEQQMRRILE